MKIENKKKLRKEILEKRNNLDLDAKKEADYIIQEKLFNSEYYKNSGKIFIYISYGSEINTKDMIVRALEDKKRIFVPRTVFKTKHMDAVEINSLDDLAEEDRYGILEPAQYIEASDPNEIDLIVVPGVAFDVNGGRMGYGAGYYDRYFKRIDNNRKIKKLALAYDFQLLDSIPMEEHDEIMDVIYTDKRDIIF